MSEQRPVDNDKYTKEYDRWFEIYTITFFGEDFEWQWFKAQAIAESNLKPTAVSHVGAKGLMQIMPATFSEIQGKLSFVKQPFNPEHSIAAGIFYNHSLYCRWKAPRPFIDRMAFTLASYNAGFGNILKAQKLCFDLGMNGNIWKSIVLVAPKVKSWKYQETLPYVDRILKLMKIPYQTEVL